jgi:pimeloyl-ACP methyl ester carboxylesterase
VGGHGVDEARYRRAEAALWASLGAEPAEARLRLDRTGAEVRVQELGAGPTVVLVHGASNAGTSWAPLVARLDGFRCVVLDRPGCGLSPPLGCRLADMAAVRSFADDLVADVLDALAVDRAHVVGTSFGGYFALRAAAAHPERVDHLATLGWSFGAPVGATPLVMRIAAQPHLGRVATRIRPTERMARSMLRQIGLRAAVDAGRFGPAEMAWFLSLLRDTPTMRNEVDALPRVLTMRGFDDATLLAADVLDRVAAPTYLLWGTDDPMGGPDIATAFAAGLPRAQLELLPGAGHAPWMDDPDLVAARLSAFLGATIGP